MVQVQSRCTAIPQDNRFGQSTNPILGESLPHPLADTDHLRCTGTSQFLHPYQQFAHLALRALIPQSMAHIYAYRHTCQPSRHHRQHGSLGSVSVHYIRTLLDKEQYELEQAYYILYNRYRALHRDTMCTHPLTLSHHLQFIRFRRNGTNLEI